jgi:two-component system, chemotaxis family, response regulator WspF
MRVAIVNDLRIATEALRRVVCSDPRHVVAWTAIDGEEAVRKCGQDTPDVILMDLVMPVMNGAEATRLIMQANPCAILVVTATVVGNFALVSEALGSGAYDAICTPQLGGLSAAEAGQELLKKLTLVERINRHRRGDGQNVAPATVRMLATKVDSSSSVPLVAIGASTGGPPALNTILSQWPKDFPAGVVIVQHIGVEFAAQLVQWLGERSKLPVRLAIPGDQPQSGTVLVAGTQDHLVMTGRHALVYTPEPVDYPYRPSVDALFDSLAACWPIAGVAVLLTGIGRDGAEGMLRLRKAGWHTIAQDEASSVVYGMPHAASEIGAAAVVLPLEAIARHVYDQLLKRMSSKS